MNKIILTLFCFVSITVFQAVGEETTNQTAFNLTKNISIDTNIWLSVVWGKPTNNLCLIAKFLNPAKRTTEKYDVYFDLLEVGSTNTYWNLRAPPKFQRVNLELYDESGKRVAYQSAHVDFTNEDYEYFSDIPKNGRGIRVGRIMPNRESPIPYDGINLTNIFQVEHDGNYKLVVKGRIIKVNLDDGRNSGDHSLSIIEFPSISLPVQLNSTRQP